MSRCKDPEKEALHRRRLSESVKEAYRSKELRQRLSNISIAWTQGVSTNELDMPPTAEELEAMRKARDRRRLETMRAAAAKCGR